MRQARTQMAYVGRIELVRRRRQCRADTGWMKLTSSVFFWISKRFVIKFCQYVAKPLLFWSGEKSFLFDMLENR